MSNVPNSAAIVLSTIGAVALAPTASTRYALTAGGIVAMTLAAPIADAIEVDFVDEVGFAHQVVCTGSGSPATAGLNGGTANNKLIFGGARGTRVRLVSRNGFWWSSPLSGVTIS
jgi:hypothetical protein